MSLEDQLPRWGKCFCFSHRPKESEVTLLLEQSQALTGITPNQTTVGRGDKKKATGFSKCYFNAFQENKQNIFRSNFLSVCGPRPHNQNRKPSPSLEQGGQKRFGLLPGQEGKGIAWAFSSLTFSVGILPFFLLTFIECPQCVPDCALTSPVLWPGVFQLKQHPVLTLFLLIFLLIDFRKRERDKH